MNKENLVSLKNIIYNPNFFDFMNLIDEEIFFQMREENEDFEENWMLVFNKLEKVEFNSDALIEINKIRELVFKNVFKQTSNSEIASYLSDDFELIAKSLLINDKNWVTENLWNAYLSNKIFMDITSNH